MQDRLRTSLELMLDAIDRIDSHLSGSVDIIFFDDTKLDALLNATRAHRRACMKNSKKISIIYFALNNAWKDRMTQKFNSSGLSRNKQKSSCKNTKHQHSRITIGHKNSLIN